MLFVLFIAAGCYNRTVDQNGNQGQPITQGSFVEDNNGFHGTLTLTGYLDIQKRVCNPGDMCGETVDYASFHFTDTNDQDVHGFLGPYEGNSFGGPNIVGIGCYQQDTNRIYYQNDADATGMIEGEIKGEDLDLLLNSNANNKVELTLTREIYTSGRGAPDCYSHFKNFGVSK